MSIVFNPHSAMIACDAGDRRKHYKSLVAGRSHSFDRRPGRNRNALPHITLRAASLPLDRHRKTLPS